MVDTNIGRNITTLGERVQGNRDLNRATLAQQAEADFKKRKLERLAKTGGGNIPAALQLANEYESRMKAGDTEGANNLAMFAKTQEKNLFRDAEGILQERYGAGDALAGIQGKISGAKEQGKQIQQSRFEPARKEDIARREAGVELQTAPEIAARTGEARDLSAARTDAQLSLPQIEDDAAYMQKLLGDVENHPGLASGTGKSSIIPAIPGTQRKSFDVLLDQVQGKQFMQAYQTLKGGGVITEIEGEKATNALARMNAAQSEEDFLDAVNDFKDVVNRGLDRARQKASGGQSLRQNAEQEFNQRKGVVNWEDLP